MRPIENVSLRFKCSANWESMTPCGDGRFCSTCNKVVYDFSDKSFDDFLKIYRKSKGKLCGRYQVSQTTAALNIPKVRKYISALFMFLGYSLFTSSAKAQSDNKPHVKHGKVEPIDTNTYILGDTIGIESSAEFKNGGEMGLQKFLSDSLNYPIGCPSGNVIVSFVVDTNGKVKDIKVLKSLRADADNEVVRVVKMFEFIPGEILGHKIESAFTLPVTFESPKEEKKK